MHENLERAGVYIQDRIWVESDMNGKEGDLGSDLGDK